VSDEFSSAGPSEGSMTELLQTTKSADGTTIAYEAEGSGAPLLVIGGALSDRNGAAAYVPLLSDRFTVVRYDRRGRGDSGDTQPFAPEREFEDLEALIAAVGGPVFVFGHSSGAAIALHTARRGAPIARLALYEPPFIVDDTRPPLPGDHLERLRAMGPDEAVEYFLTVAVQVPPPAIAGMKSDPMWEGLRRMGHTLIYDNTIMWPHEQGEPLPREWADEVGQIPTLVIDGGESATWIRNAVQALAELLPNARRLTLEGCTHAAPPETVAAVLTDFFEEER
jgi:pimeloyl-ACP methyl ester carboxylesterase